MRLSDYPRPAFDTGLGIHLSANYSFPFGRPEHYERWASELQAMGFTWVKIMANHEVKSLMPDIWAALQRHGLYPVLRIFQPDPNPGILSAKNLDFASYMIETFNVRYIEVNNEPNLADAEWKPGTWKWPIPIPNSETGMIAELADVIMSHWVQDAEAIIVRGGLPAIPALSPGGHADDGELMKAMLDWLKSHNYAGLLQQGVWIACHNYTLNHPLDFPDDPINRAEKPHSKITDPGESNGWRKYDAYEQMFVERFGFQIPVLATEGGVVVDDPNATFTGFSPDPRYPRVTIDTHRQWNVQIAKDMMDGKYPDYFFCTAHWIMANRQMENPVQSGFEYHAWYSHVWPGGHIPTVDDLKALPKKARPPIQPEVTGNSVIRGTLVNGAGLTVDLKRGALILNATTADAQGNFTFDKLAAGTYTLIVQGTGKTQEVTVDGSNVVTTTITLPPPDQRGVIQGTVSDTRGNRIAGLAVTLKSPVLTQTTVTDAQGKYRFADLRAGTYTVTAQETVVSIINDGKSTSTADLTIPWGGKLKYLVTVRRLSPAESGNNLFFGQVTDENGQPLNNIKLRIGWGTGPDEFAFARSGDKGPGKWEFVHTPGTWWITVDQGDWESETARDLKTDNVPGYQKGKVSYEVNFQLKPVVTEPQPVVKNESVVSGTVGNQPGPVVVTLRAGDGTSRQTTTAADGRYTFAGLPAGSYTLEVAGLGVVQSNIALDGTNQVTINVSFPETPPPTTKGRISGKVLNADGSPAARLVVALSGAGISQTATSGSDGSFGFANLPAGKYTLTVSGQSTIVTVTTTKVATVTITLPAPAPVKLLDHYLLLGKPGTPGTRTNLFLASDFILRFTPVVGFDPEMAKKAAKVTIVGDTSAVSEEVAAALTAAGCQVERISGDSYAVEQALADRIARGVAFITPPPPDRGTVRRRRIRK